MELNESPVFLLYHTHQNIVRKDLPVSLFESGEPTLSCTFAVKHVQHPLTVLAAVFCFDSVTRQAHGTSSFTLQQLYYVASHMLLIVDCVQRCIQWMTDPL